MIKLVCFDLDKTLIKHNSWYELNLALGVTHEEDQAMLEEFKAGRLSYQDWTKKLLELFKRSPNSNLETITSILSKCIAYSEGAKEAVEAMKAKGYHIALISGSINILVDLVAEDLGIEFAEATNNFIFDEEDRLVEITSPEHDDLVKLSYLESFCRKLDINPTECACIGDGDNDIEMFKKTGKGITFKGSKIEKDAWKVIDSLHDLNTIL